MRKIVLSVVIASLMGCSMGHNDPVEMKQVLNEAINESASHSLDNLPDSVEADLMPDLDGTTANSETLQRFRIKANGVEARAFFTSLVKGTEYSAAIHPNVQGDITVNLVDVSLDEVIEVVRDLYGYELIKKGKIIQVYPANLRTVTLPVDYLQLSRKGRSLTTISTGSITNSDDSSSSDSDSDSGSSSNSSSSSSDSSTTTGGTEIETVSESDFWPQLQQSVAQMIGSGDGRSVVVSPQASLITIRAYPDELREVRQFLDISQQRLHRQVVLEAKILEVTLNDSYQQGINWAISNNKFSGTGVGSVVDAALPSISTISTLLGGQTNIVFSDGNFDAVVNFMATQGDVNVLSSPRVTASNNQKAVIKVGEDEYYVTDFSTDITTGGNSDTITPEIELTPFFSGISLDVTPQIDDKGNVLLHVHPAVIEVEQQNKSISYGSDTIELPLAKSSIRESDSIVRAKDGDVIVIGGLMKSNKYEQISKVPFLGDIPALGHLFRNTAQMTEKTELVILLKPTVVGVNTWQNELERSRDLLNDWFPDDQSSTQK